MLDSSRFALLVSLLLTVSAYAEELVLTGGDRLQGTITEHSSASVTLEHSVLGTLSIPMDKIKTIDDRKPAAYFAPSPTPATGTAADEETSPPTKSAVDDTPVEPPIEAAEPPKKENASLFLQLQLKRNGRDRSTSREATTPAHRRMPRCSCSCS